MYSGPVERDALLRPYLRSALRAGDKCICALDIADTSQILTIVGDDDDIDLPACSASHQLDLVRASDTYLRSGRFFPADMIGFWKAAIAAVMNAAKYPCVRAIGEMSWSLRDVPGAQDVARFESDLNRILPLFPQVIMCMYDLDRFGGAFLIDVVSTHPKVLISGMLIDNPYYLPPDEWLARNGG